jgi:hypothetical protein
MNIYCLFLAVTDHSVTEAYPRDEEKHTKSAVTNHSVTETFPAAAGKFIALAVTDHSVTEFRGTI